MLLVVWHVYVVYGSVGTHVCVHICEYQEGCQMFPSIILYTMIWGRIFHKPEPAVLVVCLARSAWLRAPILELESCEEMFIYLHGHFDFKFRSLFFQSNGVLSNLSNFTSVNFKKNLLFTNKSLKRSFKVIVSVIWSDTQKKQSSCFWINFMYFLSMSLRCMCIFVAEEPHTLYLSVYSFVCVWMSNANNSHSYFCISRF